jgi:hypothetical protein
MTSLKSFSDDEKAACKRLLATRVALMMGRKFEEDDWAFAYCQAKQIPHRGWSNLHIDVMHNGLGVEHKMLCVGEGTSLMTCAGTTLMHPSATRSIRIASTDVAPDVAKDDVLKQYGALIEQRTKKVAENSPNGKADMRTGWLIWERTLTEFLYFEERMAPPDPTKYWAKWNEIAARGVRKSSKNLWIYEKGSDKKRFSVTTNAGIKIQPYFDVPGPNDPNLTYFRVQGEQLSSGHIQIWVTTSTLRELNSLLGKVDTDSLSKAIIETANKKKKLEAQDERTDELAKPVEITIDAYKVLVARWTGVSDEHRAQLFVQTMRETDGN